MPRKPPCPQYIYKILPASPPPPTPLPSALPISPLDRSSGYIHASTSVQLRNTLARFFSPPGYADEHVYILRIPYARVRSLVKWEDGDGVAIEDGSTGDEGDASADVDVDVDRFFPHIYEPELRLGREEVEVVGVWRRDARDGWTREGWPFGEVDSP